MAVNSILPAIIHGFLSKSCNVKKITLHFFERNHGQKEEIFHLCELYTLIKDAWHKPRPYVEKHVRTNEILDWKTHGQELGSLKCRISDDGGEVDWTTFKQVQLETEMPEIIKFKTSHCDNAFRSLNLRNFQALRSSHSTQVLTPQLPSSLVLLL